MPSEHLLVLGHARVTSRSGRATCHGTPQLRSCRVILVACLGCLHEVCCTHPMLVNTIFPCRDCRSWVLNLGPALEPSLPLRSRYARRLQDQVIVPKHFFSSQQAYIQSTRLHWMLDLLQRFVVGHVSFPPTSIPHDHERITPPVTDRQLDNVLHGVGAQKLQNVENIPGLWFSAASQTRSYDVRPLSSQVAKS